MYATHISQKCVVIALSHIYVRPMHFRHICVIATHLHIYVRPTHFSDISVLATLFALADVCDNLSIRIPGLPLTILLP